MTTNDMHPMTDPTYSIDIDLDALTDDTATDLMRRALIATTEQMTLNNARILADDFSDDDTDYFPADAECAYYLTAALTTLDSSPRDAFINMLNDNADSFCTMTTRLPFTLDYSY